MAKHEQVRQALRAGKGVELPDPASTPIGPGKKSAARKRLAAVGEVLAERQEALYAEASGGSGRSVLLVLQGMDTAGKGGTVGKVIGLVNPHGVRVSSFKVPTAAERRHHYLWRVRRELPAPGLIGVFDRSHYEDILVPRVQKLLPAKEWRKRYAEINAFERELVEAGTTVVKVFLHISPEEQLKRLRARLDDPAKYWKYSPADLDARARWDDYQRAYAEVLDRTSTRAAPWFAVPADHKWYRNWAVASILAETLDELAPAFPEPGYDRAAELARIEADALVTHQDARQPR